MKEKVAIFWFRRDLRLHDNAGLYHALKSEYPIIPLFIFDTDILEKLEDKDDARVTFIHDSLAKINKQLKSYDSSLQVKHGNPSKVWNGLTDEFDIAAVYTNHDYEPYAMQRDQEAAQVLKTKNISFHHYKDQVIFEKAEVVKDDRKPYTVYTPFMKKWRKTLNDFYLKSYPTDEYFDRFAKLKHADIPSLDSMGFKRSTIKVNEPDLSDSILTAYDKNRDIPSKDATSHLGVHLRFGTVSVREMARLAMKKNDTFMNELVWREFFMQILYHFPEVVNNSFRSKYDQIEWRNNEQEFERWCAGKTGFPMVDAGMRELNKTGYMHNRVRMVVASFLCKDLLIDWRWGEAYFARKLLDYDLSANNGNWQWAAGTGCDAAPYFRIFNPESQLKKFDPDLKYVRKWVPEYDSLEYPAPMLDHKAARERTINAYKVALGK